MDKQFRDKQEELTNKLRMLSPNGCWKYSSKGELDAHRPKFYNLITDNMTTSKVKQIVSTKEWEGQNGTVHFITMEMENGDKCNIGKKTKDAFKVGDEITYEVKETDQYGVKKIKEVKENPFTSNRPSSKDSAVTMCLSFAKDLCTADKIKFEELTNTADVLYDRVLSKLGK